MADSAARPQPPLQPSLLLSPLLVVELGPSFLRAGPPTLLTSPPPLSEFLEQHSRPISQKLSLVYLVIARDATNLVRSCSPLSDMATQLTLRLYHRRASSRRKRWKG